MPYLAQVDQDGRVGKGPQVGVREAEHLGEHCLGDDRPDLERHRELGEGPVQVPNSQESREGEQRAVTAGKPPVIAAQRSGTGEEAASTSLNRFLSERAAGAGLAPPHRTQVDFSPSREWTASTTSSSTRILSSAPRPSGSTSSGRSSRSSPRGGNLQRQQAAGGGQHPAAAAAANSQQPVGSDALVAWTGVEAASKMHSWMGGWSATPPLEFGADLPAHLPGGGSLGREGIHVQPRGVQGDVQGIGRRQVERVGPPERLRHVIAGRRQVAQRLDLPAASLALF